MLHSINVALSVPYFANCEAQMGQWISMKYTRQGETKAFISHFTLLQH